MNQILYVCEGEKMAKRVGGMQVDTKAVGEFWKSRIQSNGDSTNFAWFVFAKDHFEIEASGESGMSGLGEAALEGSGKVLFGGLRVLVKGEPRFFKATYVQDGVKTVEKLQVQIVKEPAFEAMETSGKDGLEIRLEKSGEIDQPGEWVQHAVRAVLGENGEVVELDEIVDE